LSKHQFKAKKITAYKDEAGLLILNINNRTVAAFDRPQRKYWILSLLMAMMEKLA